MADPGTDIETDLPSFKSDVPRSLLVNATEAEKWMYEESSIHRQQNDFMIRQLAAVSRKFHRMDEQRTRVELDVLDVRKTLAPIVELKNSLASKWTLVAVLCGPLLLAAFGAWCMAIFSKWIK